jgi:hypothetical protein
MTYHIYGFGLSLSIATAGLAVCPAQTQAQAPQNNTAAMPTPAMPTPNTADGHPDLSSNWGGGAPPAPGTIPGYTQDESGNLVSTRRARIGGSALSTASNQAQLQEELPCSERDLAHIVTKQRG